MFHVLNPARDGNYSRPKIKVFSGLREQDIDSEVNRFLRSQAIHPISVSVAVPVLAKSAEYGIQEVWHSITVVYQENNNMRVPITEEVFPDVS